MGKIEIKCTNEADADKVEFRKPMIRPLAEACGVDIPLRLVQRDDRTFAIDNPGSIPTSRRQAAGTFAVKFQEYVMLLPVLPAPEN